MALNLKTSFLSRSTEKAFSLLEMKYIRTNHLLPVKIKEDGTLLIATTSHPMSFAIDDVKRLTGMNVDVVVCTQADIEAVCEDVSTTVNSITMSMSS